MDYRAPEQDARFLLFDLFKVQELWPTIPAFADFTEDLVQAVVTEGARLSSELIAPTNRTGDEEGCSWEAGAVSTPDAFKPAFNERTGGGWLGLAGNP